MMHRSTRGLIGLTLLAGSGWAGASVAGQRQQDFQLSPSCDAPFRAMAGRSDGKVHNGGAFRFCDGVKVNRIAMSGTLEVNRPARWNSQQWQRSVPGLLVGDVRSLAVIDQRPSMDGSFQQIGTCVSYYMAICGFGGLGEVLFSDRFQAVSL